MKAAITAHELEVLAAIPDMAAGQVLIQVLRRELEHETKHALACVKAGNEDRQRVSLYRAAALDEILDFLTTEAREAHARGR